MRTAHVARDVVCRIKHCDRTVGELTFRVAAFKYCKNTGNLIMHHRKNTAELEFNRCMNCLHTIIIVTGQINIVVCIFRYGLTFF